MQREMKKLIDDLLDCVDDATDLDEGFVNKTYMAQLMEGVLIPEPPQPITEEALREKGFETSGFYYTMLQMRIGRILIYYNTISRFCMLVDGRNEIEIPNCNTVQDLDDLIRLLGGKA